MKLRAVPTVIAGRNSRLAACLPPHGRRVPRPPFRKPSCRLKTAGDSGTGRKIWERLEKSEKFSNSPREQACGWSGRRCPAGLVLGRWLGPVACLAAGLSHRQDYRPGLGLGSVIEHGSPRVVPFTRNGGMWVLSQSLPRQLNDPPLNFRPDPFPLRAQFRQSRRRETTPRLFGTLQRLSLACVAIVL